MKRWPGAFSSFEQGVLSWMETISEKSLVESMRDCKHFPTRGRSVLGNFSELTLLFRNITGGRYDFEKWSKRKTEIVFIGKDLNDVKAEAEKKLG